MDNTFTISDFTREESITTAVADKILTFHIWPITEVAKNFSGTIRVYNHSGYRSSRYEIAAGRAGDSEHCFRAGKKGAADYTADRNLALLGTLLYKLTPYNRICFYPHRYYYHCDYAGPGKEFYHCEDGETWIRRG